MRSILYAPQNGLEEKIRRRVVIKRFLILASLTFFYVGPISVNAKADIIADSNTIAAFANPSTGSSDWLFKVDFNKMKLTGGWSDYKTGLTLEIPYKNTVFQNAWFSMTDVTIISSGGISGTSLTGPGEIRFYEYGNSINPLVIIDFNSSSISRYVFGADELFLSANVTIRGSEITDTLSEEQFAFGFANLAKLSGSWNNGFTATASFDSSAVVPEPATICLLGFGALSLIRRKK
jgi:hypothetical protein